MARPWGRCSAGTARGGACRRPAIPKPNYDGTALNCNGSHCALHCGISPCPEAKRYHARIRKLRLQREHERLERTRNGIRCQFCSLVSYQREWENDRCPGCRRKYNWMLAQDLEDEP